MPPLAHSLGRNLYAPRTEGHYYRPFSRRVKAPSPHLFGRFGSLPPLNCGMKIRWIGALLATLIFLPSAPARELWLYVAQNLWVDANIENLERLFERAGKAGYTHVMLAD